MALILDRSESAESWVKVDSPPYYSFILVYSTAHFLRAYPILMLLISFITYCITSLLSSIIGIILLLFLTIDQTCLGELKNKNV